MKHFMSVCDGLNTILHNSGTFEVCRKSASIVSVTMCSSSGCLDLPISEHFVSLFSCFSCYVQCVAVLLLSQVECHAE